MTIEPAGTTPRTPVQITASQVDCRVAVIANDGTMWMWDPLAAKWNQLPALPQLP